jgi:hypothetical protein
MNIESGCVGRLRALSVVACAVLFFCQASCLFAGTIPGVVRIPQRYFPDHSYMNCANTVGDPQIHVLSIDIATNQLVVSTGLPICSGAIDFVFVISTGGAASTPAISNLYTETTPEVSADPAKSYGIKFVDPTHCRLYASYADAVNDRNRIVFTTAGSGFQFTFATSEWCWNACSQMVLQKYGTTVGQDGIADYALVGSRAGHTYDVENVLNKGSFPIGGDGLTAEFGVASILDHFAKINSQLQGPLSKDDFQDEMDGLRPAILRVGWSGGGGHVIVAYGLTGDVVNIADPWYSSTVAMISFNALTTTGYTNAFSGTGTWTHTLTTGRPLDLLFLIDTTGSMGPYIGSLQSGLDALITKIGQDFSNYRIAVSDYKDEPPPLGTGDIGDYVYRADLKFTTDLAAAQSAVNGLGVGGGGDIPEAVYSALANGLAANGIGAWRTGDTTRLIIQIGDAAGHDPEMWPGGTNSGAVLATANNPMLPIHFVTVVPGTDLNAILEGQYLAGTTGGLSANPAAGSADIVTPISNAIDTLAANPRTPNGLVAAINPLFTLQNGTLAGMENLPVATRLEVQQQYGSNQWAPYDLEMLSGNPQIFRLKAPVPIGTYRWRLDYSFGPSTLVSPIGTFLRAFLPHTVVESQYVQFTRLQSLPLAPSIVGPLPATGFVASSVQETYSWHSATNASSYAVQIYQDGVAWRTLVVQPPLSNPNAATLQVSVAGHLVGHSYKWHVQSLNFDRPNPVAGLWVPF